MAVAISLGVFVAYGRCYAPDDNYLMGGATRSQLGARSAPPLRSRAALRYRVPCQVFACAHTWQETLSLRATRPLRFVCLALPLVPTGSKDEVT